VGDSGKISGTRVDHDPVLRMKKHSLVFLAVFVILAVLHQDVWNWNKTSLVFGFMPIGLFYHMCYSIAAAVFWGLVSKLAWPHRLEAWAEESEEEGAGQ
jgi:hypothetical protein